MSKCSLPVSYGGKSCSYKKKHHKKKHLKRKTHNKKHSKKRGKTQKRGQKGGNMLMKALVPFGLWGTKHALSKKLRKKR